MPAMSRLALYLAAALLLLAVWPGRTPDQRWLLLPLTGLLWLGQFAYLRRSARASRWLLVPGVAIALGIIATYLLAESWLPSATVQGWLNGLPGNWALYQIRPPILGLCAIVAMSLSPLLLARLGLGSPFLLAIAGASLLWLSYRSLIAPPQFTSSLSSLPLPILAALWLIWLVQLGELWPVIARFWRRILPPLAVGSVTLVITLVSWQQQRQSDNLRVHDLIAGEGNRIATMLASETASHLKAMRRFTSFWDMLARVPTRSEWERQARRYYEDFGYFRNIAFIDRDGVITRVYPLRGNRSVLGINLYRSNSAAKSALEYPLIYGVEGQTGIVDFIQGGRGVISYLPVRNMVDGTLLGAIGMMVSVDNLLTSLLDQAESRDRAIMLSGSEQLYFHHGPMGNLADWQSAQPVTLGADSLTLSIRPSLPLLLQLRERLPEITLAFGILLAYLLYMVIYIYRRLAQQHTLASAANASLREEIRKRMQLQEEVEWMARHDELTQLPNRRQLLSWIPSREASLPLTLMICDIDHFKRINDHFGHLAGDRYLRLLAQRCRGPVEDAGGMFARYGGEEFVACIPHCGRERAALIADELRRAVSRGDLLQEGGLPVTLSVGVHVVEHGPVQREQCFQAADEALYRAKREGRNRVMMSIAAS